LIDIKGESQKGGQNNGLLNKEEAMRSGINCRRRDIKGIQRGLEVRQRGINTKGEEEKSQREGKTERGGETVRRG
jgi:hypothetical protein